MEIVYKNIDEIKIYANNPHDNRAAVAKVAESIEQFGFINPIAIDSNNIIIAGHTRLDAAKSLGLSQIPCIVHNLTDEDSKLVRIIDNKSHEYATWDILKLHTELDKISLATKNTFFKFSRDKKYHQQNKTISFGKTELVITDDEYFALKQIYETYVQSNNTYLGFINFLLGDKNV